MPSKSYDATTKPGTVATPTESLRSSPRHYNPPCGSGLISIGEAIGNYAEAVWAAFPDATFELVRVREIAPGQVAHEWLVRGTNTGPLMDGSAATGRTVTFPGNDVIAVEGGKIRSVEVSYDRQAADAQLGATTT